MRLAGLTALAALLVPAAAAADQASVLLNPAPALLVLAPGEVLLEVDSTGSVRSKPDTATLFVTVKSQAATAALARTQNAALSAHISEAARRAGVAAGDIRETSSPWARFGLVGNEAFEGGDATAPLLARPSSKTEASALEIRVRDLGRVDAVRTAVEDAGADQVNGPFFSLERDAAARRAAKADALTRARAEADDYARSLGMRVARILRVSERSAQIGGGGDAVEAMLASMYGLHGPTRDEVETRTNLAVDFALAPSR